MILEAARAQEQAREHADRGEFEQAQKILGEASTELRRIAPSSAKAQELLEQAEILEGSQALMSDAGYSSHARKTMSYQMRTSRQRRSRPPSR